MQRVNGFAPLSRWTKALGPTSFNLSLADQSALPDTCRGASSDLCFGLALQHVLATEDGDAALFDGRTEPLQRGAMLVSIALEGWDWESDRSTNVLHVVWKLSVAEALSSTEIEGFDVVGGARTLNSTLEAPGGVHFVVHTELASTEFRFFGPRGSTFFLNPDDASVTMQLSHSSAKRSFAYYVRPVTQSDPDLLPPNSPKGEASPGSSFVLVGVAIALVVIGVVVLGVYCRLRHHSKRHKRAC